MRQKSYNMNGLILDEACEWFVEFRAADIDAGMRQRFDEWLRRSPEHIRAYIEIARIYAEVPPPDLTGEIDMPALIAYAKSDAGNVVPLASSVTTRVPGRSAPSAEEGISSKREAFVIRRRALAASLITGVVTIASLLVWQHQRFPDYVTDIGEHRSIALSDGSTVDLNARSRLRVRFSSGERLVELLEGQALFQVAKDKSRPFIVKSAEARVRAVGTEFDVDRKASGTTVTVLEGRVVVYSEVQPLYAETTTATSTHDAGAAARIPTVPKVRENTEVGGAPAGVPPHFKSTGESGSAVYVGAGEQVIVTSQSIAPPEHADVGAATAWTQRRLVFEGTKLSDVVEEFNRNNRRQLVIESTAIEGYSVSGVYSTTDPSSLVKFLREQPGFEVTETDTEVRIAAK